MLAATYKQHRVYAPLLRSSDLRHIYPLFVRVNVIYSGTVVRYTDEEEFLKIGLYKNNNQMIENYYYLIVGILCVIFAFTHA